MKYETTRRWLAVFCAAVCGAAAVWAGELRTWTNVEGKTMEAELVALEAGQPVLRKADGREYVYALEKLSDADQAAVRAAKVPERPAGETARLAAAAAAAVKSPAPVATVAPAAPRSAISFALEGKLVRRENGRWQKVPTTDLAGVRYVAVYFSAHWCGPCRAFTPDLVAAYDRLKAQYPEFEIVFVSSDESEADMAGYMTDTGMKWTATRFGQGERIPQIAAVRERGIPNLVLLGPDGAALSRSYVGGRYRGPQAVLEEIEKTLAKARAGSRG